MPAEALLLLPGMMCDERLFRAQIDALNLPVMLADTSSDDNFAAMAQRALGSAPPRFAVLGLSMGGILAFEIWRQAPERITHLCLLNTNPHPDSAERRSMRVGQIAEVLRGGLRTIAIDALKPAYLAAANRDNQSLLDGILEMALELGATSFERQSIALRDRADSVATLSSIDCPTAIVCGAEDRLCPVEYHELMAERIRGATLHVLDDCGHLSSLEQPERVTDITRELLAQ
ncbi:MAG: alpha/beta fold hydrolase [Pseudomonadota bacterium]